jgi:hypothetical protein
MKGIAMQMTVDGENDNHGQLSLSRFPPIMACPFLSFPSVAGKRDIGH